MLTSSKNKLVLLVLISILLSHVSATPTYITTPTAPATAGTCLSTEGDKFDLYDSADFTKVKTAAQCIKKANQVKDCLYYGTDGTCYCEALKTTTWLPVEITATTDGIKWGCIPIAQQKINGICAYVSAGVYSCQCSDTNYKYEVNMDTTDAKNVNKVTTGCAKGEVPNCQKWKIATDASGAAQAISVQSSATDLDGFKIACGNCVTGVTGLASTSFTHSDADIGSYGVGCPIDGTYNCAAMTYTSGKYTCSCTGTNQNVAFTVSLTQKVAQACVAAAQIISDCATYTYNADLTKVTCNACTNSANSLVTVIATDKTVIGCFATASIPTNCANYFANVAAANIAVTNIKCYQCKSGYDKITSAVGLTISGSTITTSGVCAPAGRWIIEDTVCKTYTEPANPDTTGITYLTCSACLSTTSGLAVPCYQDAAKTIVGSATACTNGKLAAYAGTTATAACLSSGIIDNCKIYTTVSAANVGSGCTECQTGYQLVDTQFSKPSSGAAVATKQICIPSTKVDTNCAVYDNTDFSCYTCSNGLKYNTAAGRCSIPLDADAGCATAIASGGKTLCTSCLSGYTMIYPSGSAGVCVASVEKCALFGSAGCALCVNGYQLVNGACTKLPDNCVNIDAYANCNQCKFGFVANSAGQCLRTDQNTCPPGQVPSNGACVSVTTTISNCVRYAVDSRCVQCVDGKTPSSDGLSCVTPSTDRPGAKPCPANTSKTVYRRNPSNPLGDCVAVDIQCAISRDDGFCVVCKNNDYAHSDGKCYKVVVVSDGN